MFHGYELPLRSVWQLTKMLNVVERRPVAPYPAGEQVRTVMWGFNRWCRNQRPMMIWVTSVWDKL